MPKESNLSKRVRRTLRGGGFQSCRVENPCHPGFPDVAFRTPMGPLGLLELKQIPEWPKRPTTRIDLKLRPAQHAFFSTWGGPVTLVFALVQVGQDHLLLHDPTVKYTRAQLMETALWHGRTLTELPSCLHKLSERALSVAVGD